MPTTNGRGYLRSEIQSSWQRCRQGGLNPDDDLHTARLHEVDRDSRLLVSAGPVPDSLAEHLEGTSFSPMLADSSGRLVNVRCGESAVRTRVERTGAVIGQLFSEPTTGTNAISTTLELRRGSSCAARSTSWVGLKSYSCYGQPIFNRATRRLAGVLRRLPGPGSGVLCRVEHTTPTLPSAGSPRTATPPAALLQGPASLGPALPELARLRAC
jgi:transcriptional regulator of acetoin/glycerol metabolism